jgi:hypothetical protein
MPNVGIGYTRNEISDLLYVWFMIRDAIEGETAIKGEFAFVRGTRSIAEMQTRRAADWYLPRPNPTDVSESNKKRYEQYVRRAVYYNFSRRTRDGLVGQVFLRPPVVKKPSELDCLDNNADGQGLQLLQVAKRATQNALTYGRGGLFVDYPETDGAVTVQQAKEQNIQPTIMAFYPWQVVNWATKMIGAARVLSLVVLKEIVIEEDGDYALIEKVQYRALRLDENGEYFQEIHTTNTGGGNGATPGINTVDGEYTIDRKIYPTNSDGKPLKYIPFTFVGSEANDIVPDHPPMYDLCSLNIAHYRNSADFEESTFMVGQPTPVITGVTKYWVDTVLNGQVQLGSRASISLPEGANATLLQAAPNTMPENAMKQKEEQALALGAKLVQNHKTVRTATEVMVDTTSETSTLHNVANNVSAAMEQCLRWACAFVGVVPAETTDTTDDDDGDDDNASIMYRLNTEYELTRMNANDRLAIIKIWQSGAIAFSEMRAVLKVDGTASMNDSEALELIQEEQAQAALLGGASIADPLQAVVATAPENTPPPGPGGVVKPAPKKAAK